MVIWTEGPIDCGCTWHRVAWFHLTPADGLIDAFVMPKASHARPVAGTLKATPRGGVEDEARTALADPDDTKHLYDVLVPARERAGIATRMARAFVDDLSRLIANEADSIGSAMATTSQ
jgi:hypothetical protein